MKKLIAIMIVIAMLLCGSAVAQDALKPGCELESSDGIAISIGDIRAIPSENEATRNTHGWIVIDAEIVNFAVKALPIDKVLAGRLVYQDKYIFDAMMDFGQESIQPLVALKGRIIFEIPMLVAESEPGSFFIELSVNGKTHPFEIPFATIENLSMSLGGQALADGAYVSGEEKLVFEWTAGEGAEEYLIQIEDWELNKIFVARQRENRFELDLSKYAPGYYYYFVVRPLPCFDLWSRNAEAYQSFYIMKPQPTPVPTPVPTPEPTEAPVVGLVTGVTINIGGISVGSSPIAIDTDSFQISWDGGDEVASYSYQIKDENEKVIVRMENTDLTGLLVNASVLKSGTVYTITVGALPVNGTEDDIVWNSAQFMLAESAGMDGESLAVRQSLMKSTAEAIVYRTSNGKWYHLNASCSGMSGGKPYALRDCAAMKACTKCGAPDASLLMAVCEWVDEGGICHVSDDCPAFEGNYSLVPAEEAAKNNPVYCAVCASESFSG